MNALYELKKRVQELETRIVVDHRHCKDCGQVIKKWKNTAILYPNVIKTRYYELGVCESCIIEKGVKEVNKRRKKK